MNRNSVWTTHHREKIRIRDMEDTHIANIIRWLPESHLSDNEDAYNVFIGEAKRRGLSKAFIARAPYPYRSPSGQLRIWDHGRGYSKPYRPKTKLKKAVQELDFLVKAVAGLAFSSCEDDFPAIEPWEDRK